MINKGVENRYRCKVQTDCLDSMRIASVDHSPCGKDYHRPTPQCIYRIHVQTKRMPEAISFPLVVDRSCWILTVRY